MTSPKLEDNRLNTPMPQSEAEFEAAADDLFHLQMSTKASWE